MAISQWLLSMTVKLWRKVGGRCVLKYHPVYGTSSQARNWDRAANRRSCAGCTLCQVLYGDCRSVMPVLYFSGFEHICATHSTLKCSEVGRVLKAPASLPHGYGVIAQEI